ncbi:MAG: serine/threonine protein kinase, partial [bacterium]|nr:serine/threonine protein kinase [bacterium]
MTGPDREQDADSLIECGVTDSDIDHKATIPDSSDTPTKDVSDSSSHATFGRYALLERVGVGGMGEVWSAYDPELGRHVAVKILKANVGGATAEQRLVREAQAMAQLNHPNVATVHDVGSIAGTTYITMEYVEGRTLDQWLRAFDPSWQQCIRIFIEAGKGLAAAHKAELVHRDFKPSNVMIDEEEQVRVMDFGLARIESDNEGTAMPAPRSEKQTAEPAPDELALATPLTIDGTVVGTPRYMAPEQLKGRKADSRTDQFAFCIALYEALFRVHPFGSGNRVTMATRAATGAIQPPPKATRVPPRILRTVLRGLNSNPDLRFENMDQLLNELSYDPVQRRRRLVMTGLTVVTAASVALAVFLFVGRSGSGSEDAPQRLEAIWNEDARMALTGSFESTELTFARDAAAHVTASLDAYASSWNEAFASVNHSSRKPGALTDRQNACLDQRLREFTHLIDHLVQGGSEVVAEASNAVAGLRLATACAETTQFASETPMPIDKDVRDQIDSAFEYLAEARTHQLFGDYTQAYDIAVGVVANANTIDHPPLIAEALLMKGHLEIEMGRKEEAGQSLEEAFLAAETGGSDPRALRAAAELIWFSSILEPNSDNAERWWRIGLAKLSRVGGDPDLTQQLFAARAAALEEGGDYDAALELQNRVFDLSLQVTGEDSAGAASAHHQLANALWSTGNYEDALDHYERAAVLKERHLGGSHPSLATTLGNVGSSLSNLGRSEEALGVLQRALEIGEAAHGQGSPVLASTLNNIAVALENVDRFDEALASHERALKLTRSSWGDDHPQVAYSLLNRVNLRRKADQFELGLQDAEEAGRILAEAFGRDHPLYAYAANAKGMMYFYSERPTAAVSELELALQIRIRVSVDPVLLAGTRHNLARALWDAGTNQERALQLAYTARAELSDAGERGLEDLRLVDEWLTERTTQAE